MYWVPLAEQSFLRLLMFRKAFFTSVSAKRADGRPRLSRHIGAMSKWLFQRWAWQTAQDPSSIGWNHCWHRSFLLRYSRTCRSTSTGQKIPLDCKWPQANTKDTRDVCMHVYRCMSHNRYPLFLKEKKRPYALEMHTPVDVLVNVWQPPPTTYTSAVPCCRWRVLVGMSYRSLLNILETKTSRKRERKFVTCTIHHDAAHCVNHMDRYRNYSHWQSRL